MPLPTYLVRSPHGIWYARFVVPTKLRSRYPGLPREWRTSLFCFSRRAAATQARRVWLAWVYVQSLLESAVSDELPVSGYTLIEHSWGRRELHTTPEDTPAQLAQVFAYLERTGASVPAVLRALVERNVTPTTTFFGAGAEATVAQPLEMPRHQAPTTTSQDTSAPRPLRPDREPPSPAPGNWLSEAIEEWGQVQKTTGAWGNESTWTNAYRPDLGLCRELIAHAKHHHEGAPSPIWDIRMCEMTEVDIRRLASDMKDFPKRQGKRTGADAKEVLQEARAARASSNATKNLEAAQASRACNIGRKKEEKEETPPKQTRFNAKKKLARFKQFLAWAALSHYCEPILVDVLAAQMKGGARSDPNGGWRGFSQQELCTIFESPNYVTDTFDQAWQYFAPHLALTMGLRVREIADLMIDDVIEREDEGERIPCIWIRSDDESEVDQPSDDSVDVRESQEKRVKSWSAHRKLPIPHSLIACGFIDYVAKRQRDGEKWLWDNLLWEDKSGYSRYVSSWFAKYLDGIGITNRHKVFHSFRTNLHNALLRGKLDPVVIDGILAHRPVSIRGRHYIRDEDGELALPIKQVRDAMNSFTWGVTFHPSKRWGR